MAIGSSDDKRSEIRSVKNEALPLRFIRQGWSFAGNADVAARTSGKGAIVQSESCYGDETFYPLTESGQALKASIKCR